MFYLEGEDQVTELEHGLQIQPDADLMNSCRRHSRTQSYTGERHTGEFVHMIIIFIVLLINIMIVDAVMLKVS